jgi:hypothetical protein
MTTTSASSIPISVARSTGRTTARYVNAPPMTEATARKSANPVTTCHQVGHDAAAEYTKANSGTKQLITDIRLG